MRQQALTVTSAADLPTSDRGTGGIAAHYAQGGLEQNIQTLLDALGGGRSTQQLSHLSATFKALLNGLVGDGNATASALTLQGVLQGMRQDVQRLGASTGLGQIVDTYA